MKNAKEIKVCLSCSKEFELKRNTRGLYCSNQCQSDLRYKEFIRRWKAGEEDGLTGKYSISRHIKRYLFNKFDSKCCECSWSKVNNFTGNIPLEVEHIDGNFRNNKEENLKLLCPNCHSLTATYKGANKGNGRKDRKAYRLS